VGDRFLSSEDFTLRDKLFWGGAVFYGLGCLGGLVTDGFPRWDFEVFLDFSNLAALAFALGALRFLKWTKPQAATAMIYAGGSSFVLSLVHDLITGTAPLEFAVYNNLFILTLFMGPAVFLGGRWAVLVFGTTILTLMITVAIHWEAPTLARHLWFEVPGVLGVTFLLYRYRDSLDRVLADLQRAVRENEALRERERLAALGELTAGIAHEIKNPLNFVVNFAESSGTLLDDWDGADADERAYLMRELRANLEEIRSQGLRGVEIVQSMLLHSRSGRGEMTAIDLNTLAAECLHLAWLSHRTRDRKSRIRHEVLPLDQPALVLGSRSDLARALVNLCTNALHSAAAKAQKAAEGYQPEVVVRLRRAGDEVQVEVRDNGQGFDSRVGDQLFVPFFTTKAPGEGTGLGLSLTREVVVDQHHGRVWAEGDPKTGAVFTLALPAAIGGSA